MRALEAHDTAQQAGEPVGLLQPVESAPGGDERLLGRVLRKVGIAEPSVRIAEDHRLVAADQLGKGVDVAGPGPPYELGYIHGGHLLRHHCTLPFYRQRAGRAVIAVRIPGRGSRLG